MLNKKISYLFITLFSLIFSPVSLAWDSEGHRIIAQIAFDNMTPQARTAAYDLINRLADEYPQDSNFQTSASWADDIKRDGVEAFNNWHFINTPYSPDGTAAPSSIAPENIVWAITQSENVLQNQHSSEFEKAIFFRFLMHFVGDAHQPLHCVELYSKAFPHGDEGGNLYLISGEYADNLHSYWDEGLDLFYTSSCHQQLFKSRQVNCLAQQIETAYPSSYFAGKDHDLNPKDWVQESYNLDKSFVYSTPENAKPSQNYITQGQKIVEQRLALAGYRLANELNMLLSQNN